MKHFLPSCACLALAIVAVSFSTPALSADSEKDAEAKVDTSKATGKFTNPRRDTEIEGDGIRVEGRTSRLPKDYCVIIAAQSVEDREKLKIARVGFPHGLAEANGKFNVWVGGKKSATWIYAFALPPSAKLKIEEYYQKRKDYIKRMSTGKGAPGFGPVWSEIADVAVLLAEVKVDFVAKEN